MSLSSLICFYSFAQKKVLDHSVYDGWQSIGNLQMSNNGKWVVYNINVQEGDNDLIIQSADQSIKRIIPRGYDAYITEDNKTVVFKIKPLYKDIREGRIKKKKATEMPKDSLGIYNLEKESIQKFADLVSYKNPKENDIWFAALIKNKPTPKPTYQTDKSKDSLNQLIDSLRYMVNSLKPGSARENIDEGKNNQLMLVNTLTGQNRMFINVSDYVFNKKGTELLIVQTLNLADSNKSVRVVLYHLNSQQTDTLMRGGNDFKSLALSEDGKRAAFMAERDAAAKALQKFYKLWYFESGMDSAKVLVDTQTAYFPKGNTVSPFARLSFSKSGNRLTLGIAPIRPPKDTTQPDIDKVSLDIWNYKDDYLQPTQLENQKRDLERSFTAVYDFEQKRLFPIGNIDMPTVIAAPESDGKNYVVITDTGRRVASQWMGYTLKDVYRFSTDEGRLTPIKMNVDGSVSPSWMAPSGKYIVWFDQVAKNYFAYNGSSIQNISSGIPVSLTDEDNDVPANASPYGIAGWEEGEASVWIYDRYDIWKVDPEGKKAPINITVDGRKNNITYRYESTDSDERYIKKSETPLLTTFNNINKKAGMVLLEKGKISSKFFTPALFQEQPYSLGSITKAKKAPSFAYTRENYEQSPDVYTFQQGKEKKLSAINAQQDSYNWGKASLYYWTTFSGKPATGTLYLPENFDSTKKYPVIFYFYEKLSDNLYRYSAPAPTPSRLNIPFFVSRGYIVMAPDISYTIGHPAKSAYDYIVSGAQDLAKHSWVDEKRLGLQGQSWGGIQVAQVITMTPMFAAAWSGAPVANMTSAYGGIRWKGGVNRQFQYEKTQSRIGATLWEKPELYIESSPLFHLPAVTTPMVIMANDNDGAVPWYQGIELFTGLRRLGKPVWMLNYNGEEHNLVERKNRKDISIREQQFFDWLLKGDPAPKWITEGVPAINKGIDMGLELEK